MKLAAPVPNSVFSAKMAMRFGCAMPFRFWRSRRNSKAFCTKSSSCGVVRKNHLKPRWVSAGEEESAFRKGTPLRSATWLAVVVTVLK